MEENTPEDILIAEKGVLGNVFDVPEDLTLVREIVSANDFVEPKNAIIFEAMLSVSESGRIPNQLNILNHLRNNQDTTRAGGISYLSQLTDPDFLLSVEADILGCAFIVVEAARKRRMRRLGQEISTAASYGSGVDAVEVQSMAETWVAQSANEFSAQSDIAQSNELFDQLIEQMNTPEAGEGIPSGFPDLDEMTSGWHPGQMIVVGARPAVGKSTIALDFLRASAIMAGAPTAFFSLEMGGLEIMQKVLSATAKVELQKIRKGNLSDDDKKSIRDAEQQIRNAPIFINDAPGLTPTELRSQCLKLKAQQNLQLVIIDYLQLMSSGKRVESRQQEVSEFSRMMKLIAKEIGIPVIVLSQLNRGTENRSDKRPQVSDLRESGSIEQDADVIMLLDRPEQRDPSDRPGQADLILAKQRSGPTGTVPLVPILHYSKFASGSGLARLQSVPDDDNEAPPPPPPDDSFSEETISAAPATEYGEQSSGAAW